MAHLRPKLNGSPPNRDDQVLPYLPRYSQHHPLPPPCPLSHPCPTIHPQLHRHLCTLHLPHHRKCGDGHVHAAHQPKGPPRSRGRAGRCGDAGGETGTHASAVYLSGNQALRRRCGTSGTGGEGCVGAEKMAGGAVQDQRQSWGSGRVCEWEGGEDRGGEELGGMHIPAFLCVAVVTGRWID